MGRALSLNGYSDYIVYVDESGDLSMNSIDSGYPVFVLSFCIFHKTIYSTRIAPAIRQLKFDTFGHDMVVLHESEIRRKKGAFAMLAEEKREAFQKALTAIIADADFQFVAVVLDKNRLRKPHELLISPEQYVWEYGLGCVFRYLVGQGQGEKITYIICEARGLKEDKELRSIFFRVCAGENKDKKRLPFSLIVADKKTNSEGLQLADLSARPIGLSVLHPNQFNRAVAVLKSKLYQEAGEEKCLPDAGLVILP